MRKPHQATQDLLLGLFERVLSQEDPCLLYPCTQGKALYLIRHAQGLSDKFFRESFLIYPPDDPLYGNSPYMTLKFEQVADGFLITRTNAQILKPQHILLKAAFTGGARLECESVEEAESFYETLLARLNKMRNARDEFEIKLKLRVLRCFVQDKIVYLDVTDNNPELSISLSAEDAKKYTRAPLTI